MTGSRSVWLVNIRKRATGRWRIFPKDTLCRYKL